MRPIFVRSLFASLIVLAGCGGPGTVGNAPVAMAPTYVPAALAHATTPRAPSFAVPRAPDAALRRSRDTSPATHDAFFAGEAALSNGVYYLAFADGQEFGYYSYLSNDEYIYHQDLGYEYLDDANDGDSGIYFYDFMSQHFWYTTPAIYPYLYDFSLKTYIYYYTGTTNPRYFYNFATDMIFTQ